MSLPHPIRDTTAFFHAMWSVAREPAYRPIGRSVWGRHIYIWMGVLIVSLHLVQWLAGLQLSDIMSAMPFENHPSYRICMTVHMAAGLLWMLVFPLGWALVARRGVMQSGFAPQMSLTPGGQSHFFSVLAYHTIVAGILLTGFAWLASNMTFVMLQQIQPDPIHTWSPFHGVLRATRYVHVELADNTLYYREQGMFWMRGVERLLALGIDLGYFFSRIIVWPAKLLLALCVIINCRRPFQLALRIIALILVFIFHSEVLGLLIHIPISRLETGMDLSLFPGWSSAGLRPSSVAIPNIYTLLHLAIIVYTWKWGVKRFFPESAPDSTASS